MSRKLLLTLGAASFCCAMVSTNLLADEEEMEVFSDTTVSLQTADFSGDEDGAQKYRDGLDDNVALETLNVKGHKGDFFFTLEGRDLGQKDQDLVGVIGKYGKFRIEGSWDSVPRNYADGKTLGTLQTGGYWAIPDPLQGLLEPLFTPLDQRPGADAQQVLQGIFDAGANDVVLSTLRETGEIKGEFKAFEHLTIRAGYAQHKKQGTRALATGSYRRSKTGAGDFGGLGENFMLYGLELPNLVDFKTDQVDLGIRYRGNRWWADVGYMFIDFSNRQDALTWDNPLLLTGQATQGGAALNRLDLAPGYRTNMFSFNGGLTDLPLRSRVTATLSWDKTTQNDKFLAYTVNPAILDPDGVPAITRPLPVSSLNGKVETTLINLVWNARPLPKTSLNVRYNSYDYQNDTPRIDWDGWVRIAESDWKSADYVNRTPAYKKSRFGIDGTYRISRTLKFKAEYASLKSDRNDHRAADNTEDIFGGTLLINAGDWTSIRLRYTNQNRKIDGEYIAAIEESHGWQQAYMFDMSERKRDSFDAYVGIDPTDRFSAGFSLVYNDDSYDNAFYGLHDAKSYIAGIDLNYRLSDTSNLSLYFSREDRDSTQLNRTKSDNQGNGAFEVPENDWQTDLGDTTDAFGAVFNTSLMSEKLDVTVSFDQSKGKGTFNTYNTDYVGGITTSSATAYPWPNLTSDMTQLKLQLNYRWTPSLIAGFRYYYDHFKLDDFAVDDVQLYDGTPSDAQGNVLSHFIFMDANHSSYRLNFFALTLTYQMH